MFRKIGLYWLKMKLSLFLKKERFPADDTYFGWRRKGRRGCGVEGKVGSIWYH
jgi:hypothetical protein